MAQEQIAGAVPLATEDRTRMARLYEEVYARLQEMALITARTLGEDSKDIVEVVFLRQLREFERKPEDRLATFQGSEIIHFSSCAYGCYDHDRGVCEPC